MSADVGRALRVLGEWGERMDAGLLADGDAVAELRADLDRVTELLDGACAPAPVTSCAEHPYGAVDPEQPVPRGMPGVCLICEMRRRRASRVSRGW